MTLKHKLTSSDMQKIIDDANEKLVDCFKHRDIIGGQVFKLLELNSRVLYYPLEDDDVWGFMERINNQVFVCINTSIPYDKQVFVAAHELYHIWFNDKNAQELILSTNLEGCVGDDVDINELKANRFAAEFLAATKVLEQEMLRYGICKHRVTTKEVLLLCDIFTLPYKTMVRRLLEIDAINEEKFDELFFVLPEEIRKWRTILGIALPVKEDHIALDNLIEKSLELYEKNLISYERLEYLLSFAKCSPKDVGIVNSEYTD